MPSASGIEKDKKCIPKSVQLHYESDDSTSMKHHQQQNKQVNELPARENHTATSKTYYRKVSYIKKDHFIYSIQKLNHTCLILNVQLINLYILHLYLNSFKIMMNL